MNIVKTCWDREVTGNPMWCLHHKMKRLAATLSAWSKEEFGDIFMNVKDFEENVRQAEEDVINNNSAENMAKLHQTNAEYIDT